MVNCSSSFDKVANGAGWGARQGRADDQDWLVGCCSVCFTICLCISPDLDGYQGTRNEISLTLVGWLLFGWSAGSLAGWLVLRLADDGM
jgi:hypothetical protein